MLHLLKITGAVVVILGLQLNNMEISFTTVASHNSIGAYSYEPPNQGGPETSQGAGTR